MAPDPYYRIPFGSWYARCPCCIRIVKVEDYTWEIHLWSEQSGMSCPMSGKTWSQHDMDALELPKKS